MDETKFKETGGLHSDRRSLAPTSCCKRSHVLWLKLNFHCTSSSQCVRQDVPSVLLLLSLLLFHMLWLQLNFHCTPSSHFVPQHGPKHHTFYHTFISCALAKVEQLSLYSSSQCVPKSSQMCSPTWSQVSYFYLMCFG
jgi:hypothetical protein